MPGKPKLETQKTKAGNTAYQAIVGFRDMAFLAIYGTKDEKSPLDTNTLLDAVAKGMTEGKTVLSSKADMIGGYPARRILIEDADKDKIEARIVFADNRLIQALFVGPAAARWDGGSWIHSPSSIRTRVVSADNRHAPRQPASERCRLGRVGDQMFFFFSNGFGLVGSIIVPIAVTLLLLYACSGP